MSISYPGVYVEEVPGGGRSINGVATSITAFVGSALRGPVEQPASVFSFLEYEQTFGGLSNENPLSFAVLQFFQNGGAHAVIVRVSDGARTSRVTVTVAYAAGLSALEKVDLFNMLCIAPFTCDQDVSADTWNAAIAIATRRRAVVLVDPPFVSAPWTTAKSVHAAAIAALVAPSSNAAVYFPRIRAKNPLRANSPDSFAPCGAVAGVIARTDASRGVWKSPAGIESTLRDVLGLDLNVTDREHGVMNQLGVNCLRAFPNTGPVVWGARTLAGADSMGSEWKYLAVRRTALYIEESIARGLRWAVFEPNDELLWAEIRLRIDEFLHNLFRQGAFQGQTPRQAYFVRCGSDTITQADIVAGIVNIFVGFAPLKPAEFVVVKLQQQNKSSQRREHIHHE